jgi:hypothetical protein
MAEPTSQITWVIFSRSEAAASGDGAGFWSNEWGWTTKEQATRFDEGPLSIPISIAMDAVLMPYPQGMAFYRIELSEELFSGNPPTRESVRHIFECFAENFEHALEQAENAYPGCHIHGQL